MIKEIVISFLSVALFLYLLLCMFVNTPVAGGGNIKELREDVEHRWFWLLTIYIGKIIGFGFCILGVVILTLFAHFMIYGS